MASGENYHFIFFSRDPNKPMLIIIIPVLITGKRVKEQHKDFPSN